MARSTSGLVASFRFGCPSVFLVNPGPGRIGEAFARGNEAKESSKCAPGDTVLRLLLFLSMLWWHSLVTLTYFGTNRTTLPDIGCQPVKDFEVSIWILGGLLFGRHVQCQMVYKAMR